LKQAPIRVAGEEPSADERTFDVYARLLKDRVVVLGAPLDDAVGNLITAQLLHLESEDPEKDIALHINSTGGSATGLFAIYDTMQHLRPEVSTICVGQAAAAAAVLLAAGAPGKRFALPHARILLQLPRSELEGGVADIEIHAREIERQRSLVNEILSRHTGQPLEKVSGDTDRDFFLTPYEAREYGIVDEVITARAL
jgi:ATP-dependent Clp protease protease subunit